MHQHKYSAINKHTPINAIKSFNSKANIYSKPQNLKDNDQKKVEYLEGGHKWAITDQASSGLTKEALSLEDKEKISSDNFVQVSHGYNSKYPANYDPKYEPPLTMQNTNYQSPSSPYEENHESSIHQLVQNKFNWKNTLTLTFIKFGLTKLKTVGIVQFISIIAFKLKLYMIAMFLKLWFLLKLTKSFKMLMLPLFILSIIPIFFQISTQYNRVGGLLGNIFDTGGIRGGSSSGTTSFLSGLTPATSRPVVLINGDGSSSSESFERLSPVLLKDNDFSSDATGFTSSFNHSSTVKKHGNSIVSNRYRIKRINLFDPTLVFQEELNSKNV